MSRWGLIAAWCIPSLVLAKQPDLISFTESYNQTVKVSGRFHAGINVDSGSRIEGLYVDIPAEQSGKLCVSLTSVDGVYRANMEYDVSDVTSGMIELRFPTAYRGELDQFESDQIAIKASVAASCQDVQSSFLLASWNTFENADSLSILIRSDARRDIAYIPTKANYLYKAKCQRIPSSYGVSYDKKCQFDQVDLDKVEQVEIVRKNLRSLPHIVIEIK